MAAGSSQTNSAKLSNHQRLKLIRTLNELPTTQFEELVFSLNPPAGILPSNLAAQGNRTPVILQWAESPTGPGLAGVRSVLNQVIGRLKIGNIAFGVPFQRNPFFTGRQAVLERLHQQLNNEVTAAITQVQVISGLGGIGKTQTAVEYAYRYHFDERIYDTVLWVKSETKATLATDFANLARQLALPIAQSIQEDQILAVKVWLANQSDWLLIFDNADRPEWLSPFMPSNPKGRVLITSRATVFDQIGVVQPLALDILLPSEASDLLFARTSCERTEENCAAAAAINQELDGLPLALEQASAFIVRQRIQLPFYLKTYRKRGLSQLEESKAQTGQYPSSVLKTWTMNAYSPHFGTELHQLRHPLKT